MLARRPPGAHRPTRRPAAAELAAPARRPLELVLWRSDRWCGSSARPPLSGSFIHRSALREHLVYLTTAIFHAFILLLLQLHTATVRQDVYSHIDCPRVPRDCIHYTIGCFLWAVGRHNLTRNNYWTLCSWLTYTTFLFNQTKISVIYSNVSLCLSSLLTLHRPSTQYPEPTHPAATYTVAVLVTFLLEF